MTTDKEKVELYIANNLEELNQRADNNASIEKAKSATCAQITNVIETTYAEAKKAEQNRDEERAYILYMRLFACFTLLKKAKDVATNKVMPYFVMFRSHCFVDRILCNTIKKARLFGWKKQKNYPRV